MPKSDRCRKHPASVVNRTSSGRIDWAKMNALAAETLQRLLGVDIDVTKPLGSYSVAIQQMVAIARALISPPQKS